MVAVFVSGTCSAIQLPMHRYYLHSFRHIVHTQNGSAALQRKQIERSSGA